MNTFLDHYMVYASGNEVPKIYHRWAALSVVSALIGRKVWVSQGMMARIFPNTYTVLVGEPASGKSSALDLARFLLQSIGNVNMAPTATTVEALLKDMGAKDSPLVKNFVLPNMSVINYTPMHISASEIVTLFGRSPDAMISFLTDVWDREVYDNATKNKGCDAIRGPYITMLGCMTPSVVDSMNRAKMITGGFSRRVFFVEGGQREGNYPRPIKTPEQEEAKGKCIIMGKKIQGMSGEFRWSDDGGQFFDDWYTNDKQVKMRQATDPVMSRWYTAKDVLLLKMTMLRELTKEKPVLEITKDGLLEGLAMLDDIEPKLSGILGGAGRNIQGAMSINIKKFIENSGDTGVTEKAIIATFFGDATIDEITAILQFLQTTDQIKAANVKVGNSTKPGFVLSSARAVAARSKV